MALTQIQTEEELREALRADEFLLFKHSLVCPVSSRAFREYTAYAQAEPGLKTAWIDVIGQRPWSRAVESETGIAHASPQALLVRQGRVVWSASHGSITRQSLAEARAQP